MAYKFKNLVFEGGGVKGIAYVGALEVLEKEQILGNIKRVAGTSEELFGQFLGHGAQHRPPHSGLRLV